MSRYTYAGPFTNPTKGMRCSETTNANGKWFVEVEERCECGSECCDKRILGYRPHTNGQEFEESEDVVEWIDNLEQFYEDDYDQYREENSHEIRQMELYEQFKNEY